MLSRIRWMDSISTIRQGECILLNSQRQGTSIDNGNPLVPLHWDEYLAAISETFGDEFFDPMLELKQLRQIGTVREFQFLFDKLLTQCNLIGPQAVSCFLGGLKKELLEDCIVEELTPVIDSSILEPAKDTNMTTVEGETPMISYCALAGIKGAQTIQVIRYSGKKPIQILLNGGSTLNFISMEFVKRLGCTVVPTPVRYVNLGNNFREVTSGVVKIF
ncbi:hypothetical protein RDI58_010471 [Solanum bulbocastanum]|uniref:Retrotransposon gag domain-containing protein n=1 Tax=Solanum bulbocastanum TaxID=147425 RepID=A0AAN8TPD2_SOLBU